MQPDASGNGRPPLLEVEELVVRYPIPRGFVATLGRQPQLAVHAVDGISLGVRPGELVAIVGESGCGKTTTAQSVLRLVEPVSGSIRFRGQDITRMPLKELRPLRRQIQMIYQDPYESIDPRFRVRQTVEEPMLVHGSGESKEDRRR